jgi:Family of unknown function (DUF5681)
MGKKRVPNTDSTDEQQKPWQFQPGQSGNPAGRPKGSRNKLGEDFLADAYQQWQQHGSKALEIMATSEPAKFCQMTKPVTSHTEPVTSQSYVESCCLAISLTS